MITVGVGVSTTRNKTQYFINDVRQPRVINVTVVGAHRDAPVIVNKLICAQHIHHYGPWLLRLGNLAADVYCLMPNALIRFSFFLRSKQINRIIKAQPENQVGLWF